MGGNQNLTNTFMMANGTAWREQTFVRVQWGWIAAPVILVLLSVIFVATHNYTIGCTSEQIQDLEVLFPLGAAGAQEGAASACWRATELVRK
jgi:hypothetical protein